MQFAINHTHLILVTNFWGIKKKIKNGIVNKYKAPTPTGVQ